MDRIDIETYYKSQINIFSMKNHERKAQVLQYVKIICNLLNSCFYAKNCLEVTSL